MSQTHVPIALVRAVTERALGQCEYCRCLTGFSSDPFAVEHIIPEARGGATETANLALACLGCNGFKGIFVSGRDPITELDVPLFHPRNQRWTTHFAWSQETTEILGITAIGWATVMRLRLFGVHPPEDKTWRD